MILNPVCLRGLGVRELGFRSLSEELVAFVSTGSTGMVAADVD